MQFEATKSYSEFRFQWVRVVSLRTHPLRSKVEEGEKRPDIGQKEGRKAARCADVLFAPARPPGAAGSAVSSFRVRLAFESVKEYRGRCTGGRPGVLGTQGVGKLEKALKARNRGVHHRRPFLSIKERKTLPPPNQSHP